METVFAITYMVLLVLIALVAIGAWVLHQTRLDDRIDVKEQCGEERRRLRADHARTMAVLDAQYRRRMYELTNQINEASWRQRMANYKAEVWRVQATQTQEIPTVNLDEEKAVCR